MDKEISTELTNVDLRDYYNGLTKKERGNLLHFLVAKFNVGYSTIQSKFAGRLDFNKLEIYAINQIIEEGLWKESNLEIVPKV